MLSGFGIRARTALQSSLKSHPTRLFFATPFKAEKALPPRPTIDEADIEENFVKGTGPGGQKINKTASAVQLIHRPSGIIVKCQETRSRSQNRKIARRLLADRLDFQEKGEGSRVALKAAKAKQKKASADKKKRRKYKQLEDAKKISSEDEPGDENHEKPGPIEAAEGSNERSS